MKKSNKAKRISKRNKKIKDGIRKKIQHGHKEKKTKRPEPIDLTRLNSPIIADAMFSKLNQPFIKEL